MLNPNAQPCLPTEARAFARYFGPVLFSLVFVVGLVGNSSVLTILGRRRRSWRFADHYLFQLAVADLLLVLTLPFRAAQMVHGWSFGESLCKLTEGLTTMNVYTSILLLTYLSIERYFVVAKGAAPTFFVKLSHIYLTSAFFWAVGIAFSTVDLRFRTVTYVWEAMSLVCQLDLEVQDAESWKLGLQLFFFLLGFWWPVLAMVYCYLRIFIKLHQAGLLRKHLPLSLLVIIWVSFIACWAPFHSLMLVDLSQRLGYLRRHCGWEKVLDYGLLISKCLALTHCCLNPLVYALGGAKFRRELSRIFRGSRQTRPHRSVSEDFSQMTDCRALRDVDYSVMI
ncbi:PREDICTED: C-X-C chemokine receptor type 4-B-like [Thamnophis sirtalis]|uniref:C-X-C chemokine receptor type 4-B-like n=1 Tax=Thamnophis sirtalis TaxID=35019 RepID=A0A6I9YIU0_9SAUR|nr:PREDICTED: C-X-C chemokine receptor type 4-B-like [Thamnophis sirtalis]